jgi:hypothetical protein
MKVELIGGRLVLMTESPEHRNAVHNVYEALAALLPSRDWFIGEGGVGGIQRLDSTARRGDTPWCPEAEI